MANALFASFKEKLLKDTVGTSLAVTAATKTSHGTHPQGIAVILSTVEVPDSFVWDNTNIFYDDISSVSGWGTVTSTDIYGDSTQADSWIATASTQWEPANASGLEGSAIGEQGTIAVDTATGKVSFDLPDVTFESVTTVSSATIKTILIVLCGATDASDSQLLARIDTATGLPLADPAGADVTVVWDSGTAKVFKY